MPYIALGVLLAGLLFMLLNWWAKAEVKSAKRGLFWAVIGVALLLGFLLLGKGGQFTALMPVIFVAWRMFGAARTAAKMAGGGAAQRQHGVMTRDEALEVLGLSADATPEEIHAAFKRLMSQCHPDKGGSDWMAAQLNEAKRTLSEK